MFTVKLTADDDIVSEYLTRLWADDLTYKLPVSNNLTIEIILYVIVMNF